MCLQDIILSRHTIVTAYRKTPVGNYVTMASNSRRRWIYGYDHTQGVFVRAFFKDRTENALIPVFPGGSSSSLGGTITPGQSDVDIALTDSDTVTPHNYTGTIETMSYSTSITSVAPMIPYQVSEVDHPGLITGELLFYDVNSSGSLTIVEAVFDELAGMMVQQYERELFNGRTIPQAGGT